MGNNIISFYVYKEKPISVRFDCYYTFKPTGRFQWLQKIMFNFLRKKKALDFAVQDKIEVERVIINTKDFARNLWEQYLSAKSYMKPSMVYMGPDQFNELAYQDYNTRSKFSFEIKANYQKTVFNLPIVVIPHMEGVLIV